MNKDKINIWSKYARCYDALNVLKPYQDLQKTVIKNLNLKQGDIILDAGCGTGNLEWWVLKLFNKLGDVRFVAIDYCLEMLIAAKRKIKKCNFLFLRSDLNRMLPFKNDVFSKVVCINALYAICSPINIIKEFYRVLRPQGLLIIVNPKPGYENGLILKEHCGDTGPDDPWLGAHKSFAKDELIIKTVFKDKEIADKFLYIAKINSEIASNFYFYELRELHNMLQKNAFKIIKSFLVYAQQDFLIVAQKK